jgi:hypothetical protein
MSAKKKMICFLAVVLLAVGVGITIKDYVSWRHAEMDNYGHGYGQPEVAMNLVNLFENQYLGIRIRYPQEWVKTEKTDFLNTDKFPRRDLMLALGKRYEVVRFGDVLTMSVEKVNKGLTDTVNAEVKNLEDQKISLIREREYVSTDEINLIYVTWRVGGSIHQRAMAVEGNRMVVIDGETTENEWKNIEPTVVAMYKSLIIF